MPTGTRGVATAWRKSKRSTEKGTLPLHSGREELVGAFDRVMAKLRASFPICLLENLAAKVTAARSLRFVARCF